MARTAQTARRAKAPRGNAVETHHLRESPSTRRRRRTAPPEGDWKQPLSSSSTVSLTEPVMEARKRARASSQEEAPSRSKRPPRSSSSNKYLECFFAEAPAKSRRIMHLRILQSACREESRVTFRDMQGTKGKDTTTSCSTVEAAFCDFSRLQPCRMCHAQGQSTYACRVMTQHQTDLADNLASVMWSRMQHHWAGHKGETETWVCPHCGIDVRYDFRQCFICQRWKVGARPSLPPRSMPLRPTLACASRMGNDGQKGNALSHESSSESKEAMREQADDEMDAVQSLLSFAIGDATTAIHVGANARTGAVVPHRDGLDILAQTSLCLPSCEEPIHGSTTHGSTVGSNVVEDARVRSDNTSHSSEATVDRVRPDSASIDEAMAHSTGYPAIQLDSVMDPTSDPTRRRPMLSRIYLAAHQHKDTPGASFRGSDGLLYQDTEFAFNAFAGIAACSECVVKHRTPFACRVGQHHLHDLNQEALETKLLLLGQCEKNWIAISDKGWTCPSCMVCMPGSRTQCSLCHAERCRPVATLQELDVGELKTLEELHKCMGPSVRRSDFQTLLVHVVETAARNKKTPEAPFLGTDIRLIFDLFSGVDPCTTCLENGHRSAFGCRIDLNHCTDLDGSLESKLLIRMRKKKNWTHEDPGAWTCHQCGNRLRGSSKRCFLCYSWKGGQRPSFGKRASKHSEANANESQTTPEEQQSVQASTSTPSILPGFPASVPNDGTESTENSSLPQITEGMEERVEPSSCTSPTSIFLQPFLHGIEKRSHTSHRTGYVNVWQCYSCRHQNHWKCWSCAQCGDRVGGRHMIVPEGQQCWM